MIKKKIMREELNMQDRKYTFENIIFDKNMYREVGRD